MLFEPYQEEQISVMVENSYAENSYGNEEFLLDVPFTADHEVTNAVRKLKEEKTSRA